MPVQFCAPFIEGNNDSSMSFWMTKIVLGMLSHLISSHSNVLSIGYPIIRLPISYYRTRDSSATCKEVVISWTKTNTQDWPLYVSYCKNFIICIMLQAFHSLVYLQNPSNKLTPHKEEEEDETSLHQTCLLVPVCPGCQDYECQRLHKDSNYQPPPYSLKQR